ncbi:hypothetical protein D6T64_11965 [Cryobacterium melibiosiphilum]|uniref:Uncharacterized protein n=1 Tax=Cryobacterium melibiosiphilum TaxID=995039 RepID=A0A3A5MJK3_9MICO|nr:hypothetical protein [Cryobacterium melibiosiphilum]RJT88099.1 hypothetical protein D6T64_11965 [Cryobacterium melibiosiphilum]
MNSKFHTVTVITKLDDEETEDERRVVDTVTFACTAPADAECRSYPNCDCEWFNWNDARTHDGEGHARVSGRECSLQGWFDNGNAVYEGDDSDDMRDDYVPAIDRTGHITTSWMDEWPQWEWATEEVAA